jgi:Na+-transporting NADH:ubiquinone oxidoreductase subunit A
MSKVIKIKKGLDIKLKGRPEKTLQNAAQAETYALKPTDFPGLTPKLAVKVDQEVKVGTPLFFDKYAPEVKFTSPVSGKVVSINRGERRRILEVVVQPQGEEQFESFTKADPSTLGKEEIREQLLQSGLWPSIRQRPYAVIANAADTPKNIYITTFDSAPLAPDYNFVMDGRAKSFQAGVDALAKLTDGAVRITTDADADVSDVFKANNAEHYGFSGPHPKGAVGVQIHHIEPINKGDVVWYVNAQEVAAIGDLFLEGKYNTDRVVALVGDQVNAPKYFKTKVGAQVKSVVSGELKEVKNRIISGSPITGESVAKDSYIGFYDAQITVLEEGDQAEFMGWGTPGFGKWSLSRTFFSWLTPNKEFQLNTNMRGGHRPFVVTGEYDRVVPMDILPVQLLKAILIEDIDLMEQLGIYEVAEEDFALCEVVCTSKTEVQKLVRTGLDLMRKEMS